MLNNKKIISNLEEAGSVDREAGSVDRTVRCLYVVTRCHLTFVVSRVTVPLSFRILDRFSPVLLECVFSKLTPALCLINL